MREYRGLAASSGIALGPALRYLPAETAYLAPSPTSGPIDPEREMARLQSALAEAQKQLADIYDKSATEVGEQAAAIFLAHQEFLADPVLLEEVHRQITKERAPAETAVDMAFEGYASPYESVSVFMKNLSKLIK